MNILKRVLVWSLAGLVFLFLMGRFVLNRVQKQALPDYDADVALTGLENQVEVLRDSFAIPHIYAKSEVDLYRAVGFAMAQDRMWQMDLLRRVTQGRLSEIFGKDMVDTDLLMRALRIQQKSEKLLPALSPSIKIALEAFSDGVNQYLLQSPLPPEFVLLNYRPEPWEPVHSLNLIGYMAWDLSMGWETEYFLHRLRAEVPDSLIAEMIPDIKNSRTVVYPEFGKLRIAAGESLLTAADNLPRLGAEIFNGSNNWAVSGQKSVSGKPMLANDMHLGLFAPGIWYQMHQSVPGMLNVTGVVLPGQPFVICGHNERIAWGMTNVMVDDLDFYAEKLNPDSTRYWFDGAWHDLDIQKQEIHTKEGDTIQAVLRFTHRGPLVNRFKKEKEIPLSIRWLGNEMSDEIRTVYLLNRAKNWADFREAVKSFKTISQNIVYADVDGNIGLQCSAGIPVRNGDGIRIYPGDSSEYDWKGLVPFDELPYEFNPERGYVSSANNKTVGDDFPYSVSYWFATPSRISRIREMLEEKRKLDVADFRVMQADVKSWTAEKTVPIFLKSLDARSDWNELELAAIEALRSWDYRLERSSGAAAVFEVLYRRTMENLVRDELSDSLLQDIAGQRILLENLFLNVLAKGGNSAWVDDVNTPTLETFGDVVVRSLRETVSEIASFQGEDVGAWEWGKMHKLTLKHPLGRVAILDRLFNLNRGPFSVPGSYHTVCPYAYSFTNLYETNHGASHRHIYDLANWDLSLTVIPTGTSGIPASPFYLDQTSRYLNNRYHADRFGRESVKRGAIFNMKFVPSVKHTR